MACVAVVTPTVSRMTITVVRFQQIMLPNAFAFCVLAVPLHTCTTQNTTDHKLDCTIPNLKVHSSRPIKASVA
eukprot:321425-Amphidinium_carterae.2